MFVFNHHVYKGKDGIPGSDGKNGVQGPPGYENNDKSITFVLNIFLFYNLSQLFFIIIQDCLVLKVWEVRTVKAWLEYLLEN